MNQILHIRRLWRINWHETIATYFPLKAFVI